MTYRSVDVSKLAPLVAAEQPAPMLDWVPIARLLIDDDYQRPLAHSNWAAIQKIAANFQWAHFSPILVAPVENGLFAIIDGQHRVHAAAICGFLTVPAMVVLMPRAGQAAAFAAVNGMRVNVTLPQLYRAALAAGEGWAVRCDAVVASAGCRLMGYNVSAANRKQREIYAVGLVRKMVLGGQADAVRAVLTGLANCAARDKVALYHDFVLSPLFAAVAVDPWFARLDLAGFFDAHDPYRVISAADRIKAAGHASTPAVLRRDAFVALLRQHARAVPAGCAA